MRAKFGLVPTAVSKILCFKFISRYLLYPVFLMAHARRRRSNDISNLFICILYFFKHAPVADANHHSVDVSQ